RRRGQEAAQELARAFAVQLASALVESVGLVAGGVVGGDRFGLGGVWVYAGGHLSLPMMPALRTDGPFSAGLRQESLPLRPPGRAGGAPGRHRRGGRQQLPPVRRPLRAWGT